MTFLEKQKGLLHNLQDSFPDAGEAINDFWSMSGSFIYRHHVEPRVKLCSPREESFPIPLKCIDVSRTTHTNLDVKQEKRIDDYWNIDGSRDLSDSWTGFTQFIGRKTSRRIHVVRGEMAREMGSPRQVSNRRRRTRKGPESACVQTPNPPKGKIQELQNEVNCMNDSRDFKIFQDAESVRSGQSHVTSQPPFIPPFSRFLWNAKSFCGNAEPQRWPGRWGPQGMS